MNAGFSALSLCVPAAGPLPAGTGTCVWPPSASAIVPLAEASSLAASVAAWMAATASLFFLISVGVFHQRSRAQHAFPRAAIALLAFCLLLTAHFGAHAFGIERLETATQVGIGIAGLIMAALMAVEMKAAIRFPTMRATLKRLHDETQQLHSAEAEIALRAQLFEANGNVALAISSASTPAELAMHCARVIEEDMKIPFVRIWTSSPDRKAFVLSGVAGVDALASSIGEQIDALSFRQGVANRRTTPFSRADVEQDSAILDRSRVIEGGLTEFAAFPLEVEGELVGLLELLSTERLPDIHLEIFEPIAIAMGQAVRRLLTQNDYRASLDRFEMLTKLAPAAIFVSRPSGALTYTNRKWSSLTGVRNVGTVSHLDSSVSLSMSWLDAIVPEQRDGIRRQWQVAVARGEALQFEAQCLASPVADQPPGKRSKPRSVFGQVRPLPESGDFLGVLSDVTDLKRAERLARKEVSKVERLTKLSVMVADTLSNTTDETFFQDMLATLLDRFDCQFGAIGTVGDSEASLWDASLSDTATLPAGLLESDDDTPVFQTRAVLDRRDSPITQVDDRCPIVGDLALVWESGRPGIAAAETPSPFHHRKLNGLLAARISNGAIRVGMILIGDCERRLNVEDRDLLDRAAHIVGAIVTSRLRVESEQIERKRAEQSLRAEQQKFEHLARIGSMGELAAGLAHELNQPLAAIINYGDSLQHRLPAIPFEDREKAERLIDRISSQAKRAAGIVSNLRAMIRKGTPDRGRHSLPTVVERALELMQPDARLHDVRLDYAAELLDESLDVYVNPVEIQQVVVNLVQNAIDAVRKVPNGHIAVAIDSDGTDARLIVADNGDGVPDRPNEAIFESFFTTKPQGMGVGLRICRTIVEAHGGRIGVTDAELGGLEFIVSLPTVSSESDTHTRIPVASAAAS